MLAKAGVFMEKIGVNKASIPYISPILPPLGLFKRQGVPGETQELHKS